MKIDKDESVIIGFKDFSVLANEYFPSAHSGDSAMKKCRLEIENSPELLRALEEAGYSRRALHLSPKEQEIIRRFWGAPIIRISTKSEQ